VPVNSFFLSSVTNIQRKHHKNHSAANSSGTEIWTHKWKVADLSTGASYPSIYWSDRNGRHSIFEASHCRQSVWSRVLSIEQRVELPWQLVGR